jgi:hypothetical protein
MPSKGLDENIQVKAVRHLPEDADDYDPGWPALGAIRSRVGLITGPGF